MLFNSFHFLMFFPIVVLLYFIIPKRVRYIWLLMSSYYFYMSWNPKYILLILFSTVVTYACGLIIGGTDERRKRKFFLVLCIVLNLAVLFSFKYFNFAVDNINMVLGKLGIQAVNAKFDVLLPVGISFYTFQALSYTIDVYRKQIEPEKNFLRYALFVSFFPQLVAGPIERSGNLLKQIQEIPENSHWDFDRVKKGMYLILWGLFMKMVIADRISIFVDDVFENYKALGTFTLAAGAVGFAIQIYCDFASYSTIAVGAANVMSFTLMENFDTPYLALSIKEFWRRWHISLSTWFRDYLYIPLGGNRKGTVRKYINVMITFLVSGLWHGANWTYIVWGGIHGLYQVIGDLLTPIRNRIVRLFGYNTESRSHRLLKIITTFALTDIAWIFFRADNLRSAVGYIGRLFTRFDPWVLFDESIYNHGIDITEGRILIAALLVLVIVDLIKYYRKITVDVFVAKQNIWFQIIYVYIIAMALIIFGKYGISEELKSFIYFQF